MIEGKVWKYGDDVNTDVIFAGKYTYKPMTPAEMAAHALEDLDPTFAKGVKPGDILVAGATSAAARRASRPPPASRRRASPP